MNKHIERLIKVAEGEIGYLEKRSNSNLDSKTANAGSNNYTKYWRDVYPAGQAQAWCAIFVNWCFDKAFGKANTKKLLKHYPYTYCPTMGNLFTRHANPEVGDIVIFKSGGSFVHTGLVVEVSGDRFRTIEGNTSGASGIIANGGGVCKKTHYNSNLPGTKFCRPDYDGILGADTVYEELSETKTETEENIVEIKMTVLEKGAKGEQVKTLQRLLNALGYNCGSVDGDFGNGTLSAVKSFQKGKGLTVDGIVGKGTWSALLKGE